MSVFFFCVGRSRAFFSLFGARKLCPVWSEESEESAGRRRRRTIRDSWRSEALCEMQGGSTKKERDTESLRETIQREKKSEKANANVAL